MEFLTVRDFKTSPKAVWEKLADKKRLVITNKGKPMALMLGVDGASFEETLASIQQAEAMRLINKIQRQSVLNGTDSITMDEIDAEVAAARKERASRKP